MYIDACTCVWECESVCVHMSVHVNNCYTLLMAFLILCILILYNIAVWCKIEIYLPGRLVWCLLTQSALTKESSP